MCFDNSPPLRAWPPALSAKSVKESRMSKGIKSLVALGLVVLVAACGNNNEPEELVIIEPAPIQSDPVSNKF